MFLPRFERWLAPREPIVGVRQEQWAATFERRDRFLAADPSSPRLYSRQLELDRVRHASVSAAFLASPAAGWCDELEEREPPSGAQTAWLARPRSGFLAVALLFEPDAALLVQTRPGAGLTDVLDASTPVSAVEL